MKGSCNACLPLFVIQNYVQVSFTIATEMLTQADIILEMGRNFEDTGSALRKKGGSVNTVRTLESTAVVREATERSPHRSARRHSVSLGLSEASVRRILHKDLHVYPYKIQVTHALLVRDYVKRVNFCHTCLQLINQNQDLFQWPLSLPQYSRVPTTFL